MAHRGALVAAVAVAALLVGCAAGTPGTTTHSEATHAAPVSSDPHPLRASDLDLDFSPAASIVALWQGPAEDVPARARAIATELPYQTVRNYLTTIQSCVPTDAEVGRAIAVPDSGVCGFGLGWAHQETAALDSLVRALVLRSNDIRGRVTHDAGAYVPAMSWRTIRVYFVLASRDLFDAVTLDQSLDHGGPVIVFNLTEALTYGHSTAERAEIVERVLAHECFHAALRQVEFGRDGWAAYHDPLNAFDYIARVFLDEGVAHYVDWKERAGADTLFATRLSSRERKAFDQLALACRRIRDPRTEPEARAEILGLAATGPMWSKYAAVSGMFAAWRIERKWGIDSLRASVVGGPRAFRRLYRAAAAADTSLKKLPRELD